MNRITTEEIETRLAGRFNYRQNIVVPNVSWGINLHECDLLVIRKSGYAIEVEIKVSKSDLKADAKKGHNHIDRFNRLKELWFAIPEYMQDCIELIPENAGIIILSRSTYDYGLDSRTIRKAQINRNSKQFSADEMLKVAHLGAMRIWDLKRKLNKNRKRRVKIIDKLQTEIKFKR